MSHPANPVILSSSKPKNIFVTGGTGHTGSRLVARLLERGHHVTCLTRGGDRRQFLPAHGRLNIIEGNIESGEPTWTDSLRGCDAVFHIAHIRFAPRIIAACRAAGVRRLICMSSTRRFTAFPEQTARWVIEGESALESSGLDYTVLRPTMIYGWERDNNLEKLVRYLRKRRFIPLVRGGRNLMQPVFVEDVVDALLRALATPQTAGRMLTIAGPNSISLRDLIETVAREMKVNPIWIPIPFALAMTGAAILEMLPGRPLVTRDQIRRLLEDKAFDIADARTALSNWSPRSFEEGIREKVGRLFEPTAVDERNA